MQLLLFILLLITHLLFCKFVIKSFTLPFSLYGIIWFVVLIMMQLPIIKFEPFAPLTLIIFVVSYFAFLIPHLFVRKEKLLDNLKTVFDSKIADRAKKLFRWLCLLTIIFTGLYIYYIVSYYGGIAYILQNSYAVRHDSMGQQIAPLFVTYCMGVGYVAAGIGSYLLFFTKSNLCHKIYYLIPFVLGCFADILTSSRMGILFYSIIYFGALLLRYNFLSKETKRRYRRIIFVGIVLLLVILFIPKYLRDASVGGSDYSGYTEYLVNQDWVNFPLIGPIMHYFIYITGPVAGFNQYIINFAGEYSYGQAQLLPLVHIVSRITGNEATYDILYDFVEVPFTTNIYTYLREAYSDFGFIGIMITPLFLGLLSLIAANGRFKNKLFNLSLLQYVYVYAIFAIFYTPFSQGGPTIGFVIYFALMIIMNMKMKPISSAKEITYDQLYSRNV